MVTVVHGTNLTLLHQEDLIPEQLHAIPVVDADTPRETLMAASGHPVLIVWSLNVMPLLAFLIADPKVIITDTDPGAFGPWIDQDQMTYPVTVQYHPTTLDRHFDLAQPMILDAVANLDRILPSGDIAVLVPWSWVDLLGLISAHRKVFVLKQGYPDLPASVVALIDTCLDEGLVPTPGGGVKDQVYWRSRSQGVLNTRLLGSIPGGICYRLITPAFERRLPFDRAITLPPTLIAAAFVVGGDLTISPRWSWVVDHTSRDDLSQITSLVQSTDPKVLNLITTSGLGPRLIPIALAPVGYPALALAVFLDEFDGAFYGYPPPTGRTPTGVTTQSLPFNPVVEREHYFGEAFAALAGPGSAATLLRIWANLVEEVGIDPPAYQLRRWSRSHSLLPERILAVWLRVERIRSSLGLEGHSFDPDQAYQALRPLILDQFSDRRLRRHDDLYHDELGRSYWLDPWVLATQIPQHQPEALLALTFSPVGSVLLVAEPV